ncbi:hypothetical protein ACF068_29240 [Streptomyces sp. NPDC016309]|uniref:hypothetical protein n=1 Tax=Streptomyces sp. NPDC016309 TaxID=3364965 RepID=UPI0036FF4BF8
MLTTVLARGSAVFDRRTLLSAFLPAVVFWGLTAVAVLDAAVGRRAALHGWQAVGAVAQGLALAAFLVWCGLWAFLTAAMSTRSLRFLAGHGSGRGAAGAVRGRLRARHLRTVDALEAADTVLEVRHLALLEAGRLLAPPDSPTPPAPPDPPAPPAPRDPPAPPDPARGDGDPAVGGDGPPGTEEEREVLLERAESAGDLSDEDVRDLPGRLRAWWDWSAPPRPVATHGAARAELSRRLDAAVRVLARRVARSERSVEAERAELLARLGAYPAERSLVMPTALGNVVRAVEGYGGERYGVDTVLVWPRLHPLLPEVVVKAEAQARTVLDLLLNVCLSVVLFGLPLSVAVPFGGVRPMPWWLPLLPLLCAVAVRSAPAALLSAAALAVRVPELPDGWSAGRAGVGLPWALTGLAVVALLATATYRAAVESAVAWGEHVKAAVDLHRWRLLDELHMGRPADPGQERLVWGEVTGLLHRGYAPDPSLVRYGGAEQAYDAGAPAPRLYPVPVRTLPAFHPVAPADVQPRWVWRQVPDELCATAVEDVVGRCPLQPLEAGRPVPVRLLLGADAAAGPAGTGAADGAADPGGSGPLTAVGLAVTGPDGLGGTLRPGDRVDLSLFAADHTVAAEYPGVLVLRHLPAPAASGPGAGAGGGPGLGPDIGPDAGPDTLVVAVEPLLATELTRAARDTTAVVTRPLPLPPGPPPAAGPRPVPGPSPAPAGGVGAPDPGGAVT